MCTRGLAFLVVVLVVSVATAAEADLIVLTNGREIQGEIERETADAVVIRVERGRLTIARRQIRSLQRDTAPPVPASEALPSSPEPSPAIPARGTVLWEAPVTYEVRGNGISTVRVTLRSTSPDEVRVLVPAGSLFVAKTWEMSGAPQDMLAVADGVTSVPAWGEAELEVSVACARMRLRIPSASDHFDLQPPRDDDAARLGRALKGEADWAVKQAAVWIITDDADYEALGTLRTGSAFSTSRWRTIGVLDAIRAVRHLDAIGVDIRKRRIWADRYLYLRALALDPGESDAIRLRVWASRIWRELGYPEELPLLLARIADEPNAGRTLYVEALRIANEEGLSDLVPVLEHRVAEAPSMEREPPAAAPSTPAPAASETTPTSADTVRRISHLLVRLRDRDPTVVQGAIRELKNLSAEISNRRERGRIAEALLGHAQSRVLGTASAASLGEALRAYRDVVSLPRVLVLSRSTRTDERGHAAGRLVAASVLGSFSEAAASQRLAEMLADEDRVVRRRAAQALRRRSHVGSPAERTLLRLLQGTDEEPRLEAVEILGCWKSQSAVRPLIERLRADCSPAEERTVVSALVSIGAAALPEIDRALTRGDLPALRRARDRIGR